MLDAIKEWAGKAAKEQTGEFLREKSQVKRDALRGMDNYRYVRKWTPKVVFVAGTCDCKEIDEKAKEYWEGIWKIREQDKIPEIEDAILEVVEGKEKADCVELEAVHMRKYLSKKGGASGSCGWGHKELKALHERLHDSLAEIFNAMEKAGVSPTVSHEGDVTLIPKGIEAAGVDNLRPITVLSSLHRLGGNKTGSRYVSVARRDNRGTTAESLQEGDWNR